jgi:ParB-like chromosome segregation protein Spo0J
MRDEIVVQYYDPKKLKVNEYSRNLFPKLDGEPYEMLKNDIKENGIRTPLEITKDGLILCGHERHRIALQLGFNRVPVTFFEGDVVDQKIHLIKDNLARKSVDFRTKLNSYRELRKLYGLRRGGDRVSQTFIRSTERLLSEDDIAKEVGFSRPTMERAGAIEDSNLPEEIKDATFKGLISIRGVAEVLKEPEIVQERVVEKVSEALKQEEDHVNIFALTRDVKQSVETESTMENIGVPSVEEQVQKFYEKVSVPKKETSQVTREDIVKLIQGILKKQKLTCRECGEQVIQWKCGHEFS